MSARRHAALWVALLCLFCTVCTSLVWMRAYRAAGFAQVSALCETLAAADPALEPQLLAAVQTRSGSADAGLYLSAFGYAPGDFSAPLPAAHYPLLALLALGAFAAPYCADRIFTARAKRRISALTRELEKINLGGGALIPPREDALSPLQDEIYKTVGALRHSRESAQRARARYADNIANIAHQLKTPLTAALLSLELLQKSAPNLNIAPIEAQLRRLNRLEEALLTLSRIDAGALALECARVDAYTAFNIAADGLSALSARRNVRIEIADCGQIAFEGDLEWTSEALGNLIKNCLEHTPPGGCVRCDYAENPLYVELRVRDEGPGFAPEDIPRLFERFYRGRRAQGDGVGIGLTLAREIFGMQKGALTARNLPGGGACFEARVYRH